MLIQFFTFLYFFFSVKEFRYHGLPVSTQVPTNTFAAHLSTLTRACPGSLALPMFRNVRGVCQDRSNTDASTVRCTTLSAAGPDVSCTTTMFVRCGNRCVAASILRAAPALCVSPSRRSNPVTRDGTLTSSCSRRSSALYAEHWTTAPFEKVHTRLMPSDKDWRT